MRNRLPHISLLAAVLATLAFCGSASADSRNFSEPLPISPADPLSGQPGIDAAQYPSQIRVGGMAGTITDVKVQLRLVNGSFPADLDVLLVSPAGQKLVLMSDAGSGGTADHANLVFSDAAATNLPLTGNLTSGTYKPTNLVGGDGSNEKWPFPAPPGPYDATKLSTFAGAEPNGNWRLYVTDDGNGDKNQIMGGWDLTISTTGGKIFRDSTAITAIDRVSPQTPPGISDPYPAAIDVTGMTHKLDRVTVTLHDIAFPVAGQIDLLLVGPDGQSVVLMSDAGGGNDVFNADIGFDDAAATSVTFPLDPVVHKPSDDDRGGNPDEPTGVDVFPAPAPPEPYGNSLGAFKGTSPNGTWKLFMTDGRHNDLNAVNGGWSLNFTFSDQPVDPPATPAPQPAPQPQPAPIPTRLPAPAKVKLSALKLKPSSFTAAKGTVVSYKLSGKAQVKLSVLRKGKVQASLTRASKAGANKLRFKPRKLAPGSYSLTVKPVGGGPAKKIGFRVKA
jgi:subtilisin-like proprotein convertase family protein